MEFFENFTLFPDSENLLLLKILNTLLTGIYFLYVSIFTGTISLSVVFKVLDRREPNPLYQKFAQDLLKLVTSNKSAVFLLGILPLITLIFSYAQIYQGTSFKIVQYFTFIIIFTIIGFVFSSFFKFYSETENSSFIFQAGSGLLGIIFFIIACFILSSTTSLLFYPEKWLFVKYAVPFFVYENVIPRFLLFTLYILSITGAAVLFFFFHWPGRTEIQNSEYAQFVKKFSAGLSLITVTILPVFILWNMLTFPDVAKSGLVYNLWIFLLLILMITALLLYTILKRSDFKYGAVTFTLFLISFLTVSTADQIAGTTASYEQSLLLIAKAEKIHQKILIEREERVAASQNIDGSELFAKICSSCHKFDQKVVGPPLNQVKEKYENDVEGLKAFILNPVKIRPDFPPMPKQVLNRFEVGAVAEYLIEQWSGGAENK